LTFRLSFSSMTASLLVVRCSRTFVRSAPLSSRSLSCRKSPARFGSFFRTYCVWFSLS